MKLTDEQKVKAYKKWQGWMISDEYMETIPSYANS